MKLIIRSITALCFRSIELIEVNATLDKNGKLDIIVIAFFDSAITNLIDDSNKEENNLIDFNSNAIEVIILRVMKATILGATKE